MEKFSEEEIIELRNLVIKAFSTSLQNQKDSYIDSLERPDIPRYKVKYDNYCEKCVLYEKIYRKLLLEGEK